MRRMVLPLKTRIQKARTSVGLNKAQFAAKIGVTRSALTQIEGGMTRSLSSDTAIAIEKLTGYRAQWLVHGDGQEMHAPGARYRFDAKQQGRLLELFDQLTGTQRLEFLNKLEEMVASNKAIAAELGPRITQQQPAMSDGVPKSAIDLNAVSGRKRTKNVA